MAAEVRAAVDVDQQANQDQQAMPQITMKSKSPVNMAKTIRYNQRGYATHQAIILHKGVEGGFCTSGG